MNKSPDPPENRKTSGSDTTAFSDHRFAADLANENRLQSRTGLNSDPELSADRALKEALSQLQPPMLSDEIKRAVRQQTQAGKTFNGWWAMAAAVVLSVLVVTTIDPFSPHQARSVLTAQDWAQLDLALETFSTQGQQIAQVTRAQVSPHLTLPRFEMPSLQLELDPLPYPDSIRRWFQPSVPQPR